MFQTLSLCYKNYRWLRIICGISLFFCGVVFIILFGGFPPLAWHFLAQVVVTLPVLWTTRGLFVVLPLLGLVLQSFLIVVLWGLWLFASIKALQYEFFQSKPHVVQADQEKVEVAQHVQHTPLPAQSSPFDAFPDTVYPRMPSSARRYSAPSAPAQHTSSSSPIPARASAHPVAVQESVQMLVANHSSREAGRPQGSPLHLGLRGHVGETLAVSPKDSLYTRDMKHYGEYTIEEFTEYEPFLDEFDEDQVCDDDELQEQPQFSDEFDEEQACEEDALQEQPHLRLIVGIGSHPGIVRKNGLNEDNVLGLQDTYVTETDVVPVGLFVVADGMGGHAHGQEASRLAVCSVSEVVTPILLNPKAEDALSEELLEEGVQRANIAIHQHNQQKFTMGTTITTALIFGSTAYVANVGDSRTYLYRASEGLLQITSDHSHVWQLFKGGCIKHEDIYTHPKRNEIYRCLGESAQVEIDTFQVTLQAYDVLLLCTDGLWEMVRDAEIEHIMQDNALNASRMSAKLIEAALHNGGADNVSAVVVCIDSSE